MHIKQHEDIVKELLGQRDKYTGFNPWMAFKFTKSKYTFSFYQWCCQWKKKGTFELTNIRIAAERPFQINTRNQDIS